MEPDAIATGFSDLDKEMDSVTDRLDALEGRLEDVDTSLESIRDQIGAVMGMWEAANERRRREIEALRTTLARQEDDMRYELDRLRRELDSRLRRW